MQSRALRTLICLLCLLGYAASSGLGQDAAQHDIYSNFVGAWAGTGVFFKNGVRQENPLKITITETKKRDRLRLDYDYAKTATADHYRETKFLRLDPPAATLEFSWADQPGEKRYRAEGLNGFSRSGFGKFAGLRQLTADEGSLFQQASLERITFVLTKETLSYEWEWGSDKDHMKFYSLFRLTRIPDGPH